MLHLLNWGMGVESTWLLVDWIKHPETRPFENLEDLIVLVAQTGDEYDETAELSEKFILPLLREHNIRLVQVARAGASESEGYIVLGDSRQPEKIFHQGAYKLSEELLKSGTVPRLNRPHYCAMKFKGTPLDGWIGDWIEAAFGPYIGYNCDETKREKNAQEYGCRGEFYRYPLIERSITRTYCLEKLFEWFAVTWPKSCCVFCPFQQKTALVERWLRFPEAAGFSAYIEAIALAFNPRMKLFGDVSAYELLEKSTNLAALADLKRRMDEHQTWAVYRVQRTYTQRYGSNQKLNVNSKRWLRAIATGSQNKMLNQLSCLASEHGAEVVRNQGISQVFVIPKGDNHPTREDLFVVFPHIVPDKVQKLETFLKAWAEIENYDDGTDFYTLKESINMGLKLPKRQRKQRQASRKKMSMLDSDISFYTQEDLISVDSSEEMSLV